MKTHQSLVISGNRVDMTTCRHPDCTAPVRRSRMYHLCETHIHTPGLCTCKSCRLRQSRQATLDREARRAERASRTRTIRAEDIRAWIPTAPAYGQNLPTPISLLAEPWETTADPA